MLAEILIALPYVERTVFRIPLFNTGAWSFELGEESDKRRQVGLLRVFPNDTNESQIQSNSVFV